ncbi:MAG TPA: hypothetical protein P5052_01795 [Candidatus Paceibacterota bacterium]|jgi:hypothetical protein|nr:hypothetical protein [Candidatus Paceibacterota bacterium]HRZ29493.1 hypothetical protein [Candidatus Paceibacterota bacterium]
MDILPFKLFRKKRYVKKIDDKEPSLVIEGQLSRFKVKEGYVLGIIQDCHGNIVYTNDVVTLPGDQYVYQFASDILITDIEEGHGYLRAIGESTGGNGSLENFHGKCEIIRQSKYPGY